MRAGTFRRLSRHYALSVASASVVLVAAACAPRRAAGPRPLRAPPVPLLLFDNATIEPVRVYLVTGGSEWLVGRVEPGRVALLRLPVPLESLRAREVSLSVVPLASGRPTAGASATRADAIRSEPLAGSFFAGMRWRLVGKWLVAYPLPQAP